MTLPSRLVISNFKTGFERDLEPYLLGNDAFPFLENCYVWRGRLQKKRGTQKLGRLARQITAESVGALPAGTSYFSGTLANSEIDPSRIQLYVQSTITNVTAGATTLITAPGHQFVTGQSVTITGVSGTGTIGNVNNTFTIVGPVIPGVSFTISLATAGLYTSGGVSRVYGTQSQSITGVTNANPAVVSFAPMATPLPVGDIVQISGVNGITLSGSSVINGPYFTIGNPLAGSFELNGLNTNAPVTAYLGGGTWTIFHDLINGTVQTIFQPPFSGPTTVLADYSYFPDLPVMGIESFENYNSSLITSNTIFLDTQYSYQFALPVGQRYFYDTSFYKVTNLPITWHGTDAQQFWTANFENAMYATQNVPGLNGVRITSITNVANPVITTTDPHLIPALGENDWIFIAGVSGLFNAASSPPNASWVNGLSLQINVATTVITPNGTFTITATVTGANTIQLLGLPVVAASAGANGFLQVLTKQYGTNDGIHWYDGDPTQTPLARFGWVNFAPPINSTDPTNPLDFVSFLVGAKLLTSFGGAMMALGTWEISTDPSVFSNGPIFNPQRIRWCTIAGTPFYANPVPTIIQVGGQAISEIAADPLTWVSNLNGRGGYLDLITHEEIISVNAQQESLIIGLEGTQRRLAASGSVINPFIPYVINPEYGTQAPFSTVALDKGVLSVGDYGFILTTSFNAQRFDLKIPDQVFQFKQFITNIENGPDRVCAVRNWQEETIHFTYVDIEGGNIYPNRTVYFNYRDPSFAILKESYTTYGYFRDTLPLTWSNLPYLNWNDWLPNWFAFNQVPGYPDTAGGNQQGYVMLKDFNSVTNDFSLKIIAVGAFNPAGTSITSPNHNLEIGDFVWIDKCIGLNGINKTIAKVIAGTDFNTLVLDTIAPVGTYLGGGEIIALDNFFFQTKEFAQMWNQARGSRLGTQRFLLNKTDSGEFTVALFVSQNFEEPANIKEPGEEPWIPSTSIVRTKPDQSLGIRGSASRQEQIWHRNSVSVLGDGVQMGGYISDSQMRKVEYNSANEPFPSVAFDEFALQAIVIDLYGSRTLI